MNLQGQVAVTTDSNMPADITSPGKRLKYIRSLLRVSRSYIQQKYGLSADTLNAWESEKAKLTEKGLEKCIKIYSQEGVFLSKNWVLTGEGFIPKLSMSIENYFDSPIENTGQSLTDNGKILQEVEFFKKLYTDAIVLLVNNDDMKPIYVTDDFVGGRLRSREDIQSCAGKDCIVLTTKGEKHFRRVAYNLTTQLYNLSCLNYVTTNNPDPVIFNVDIAAAAPVIWHRKSNQ